MNKQKCFDCGTEFIEKPWIDVCPMCRSKHIIHDDLIKFINLGDINFLEYGGNLVFHSFSKEDCENFPDLYEYYFTVLKLYTPWDLDSQFGEESYILQSYQVDVRDYEDKKDEILSRVEEENKKNIPWLELWDYETLASEIVNAGYGDLDIYINNGQKILNIDEVKEILCNFGIFLE